MKLFCLICLIHVSLQLSCDRSRITAHVGGEFILFCSYNTNHFLFSKKYWCKGSARNSCQIVVDSEKKVKNGQKSIIVDAHRRGLYVKVIGLRFEDAGTYWVGIDKVYADIMTSVEIVVTEVPVFKPTLWPLTSLVERPSCWGRPVTVRCGSTKGTSVGYEWYQQTNQDDAVLVLQFPDLKIDCDMVQKDTHYYCVASNNMGQQKSDPISVQVLIPAESQCMYAVKIPGQPNYDCADRLTTTTATTAFLTTTFQTTAIPTAFPTTTNYSSQSNHIYDNWFNIRAWTSFPPWYLFTRWGLLLCMLVSLLLVVTCSQRKRRLNRVRRRKTYCT